MKIVLQSLGTGETEIVDVPAPQCSPGRVLIRASRSLISAGTERMIVEFGQAGWIDKARQQPDKVRQVLDKVLADGVVQTVEAVRRKLDQPIQLGYCHVGEVVEVGAGVTGFYMADRVASNGNHAEYVSVPANLCVKIPDNVTDDAAAFTVIGAIALQGIRLVAPTLGETVVVTGLGLVGLLAVQLLRAHGCRVLGIDYDETRIAIARRYGAETVNAGQVDVVAAARAFARGRGVDAVLLTAATESSEPVHQAAAMCRKRGRIVLVGVTGLELSRADFYEKELTFQVSCSYGPGRYDAAYEERGQDYPFGLVRWTEQRNFEAVVDMMSDGRLDVLPLITHRFSMAEARRAYAVLSGSDPSLGILLEYPSAASSPVGVSTLVRTVSFAVGPAIACKPGVSVIGAGNYSSAVLLPALKNASARLRLIATAGGASGVLAARKFGFESATTDVDSVFGDQDTSAVVVATRHDSHAEYVLRALRARKHVFVEKPLCLNLTELEYIESEYNKLLVAGAAPILTVGFNRRFSPFIVRASELLSTMPTIPKAIVIFVNGGAVPVEHWTQDLLVGGGRIVGEACHFIDLLRFLVGVPIASHRRSAMRSESGDTATLSFEFTDGSIGTVHYFANGHRAVPKERVEIYCGGRVLRIDNFRSLSAWGWKGFKSFSSWRQDKGQSGLVSAFVDAIAGRSTPPIPVEEIFEVARLTILLKS